MASRMKKMPDSWCGTTYRQSKKRLDSLTRAAAVAAPLAVMSVRLLGKDRAEPLRGHLRELESDTTISLCRERWNSKDLSQITNNVVTKLTETEVSNFIQDLHGMVPDPYKKYVDWDQTRTEQGTWPTKTMVNMWFSNETNLPTRVGLLDTIRTELKKEPYKLLKREVTCRLELHRRRRLNCRPN